MTASEALPPSARLRRRDDVRRVAVRGSARPGRECVVRRLSNPGLGARLAIAAPRAYGGAVERNRFRRLVREAFRRVRPALGDLDVLVSPRRGLVRPTLAGISADLTAAADGSRAGRPAAERGTPS